MTKPLIIAHRGASDFAPENTLAAFQKAIEANAEGIEFDVQFTKDLIPIVFHDGDLKRIAGDDSLISELNLNKIQNVDAGSWFNRLNLDLADEKFVDERISTLGQTLDFFENYKGIIYIELKDESVNDLKIYAKTICDVIKNSHLLPNIIVKSFNLDLLPLIKKYCPNAKTAALFSPTVMILLRKEKRLINIAKELKVDGLSLHLSLPTKKLMRLAKRQNLKVAIWTAENPLWVKRGLKLGIDHIITNNPAKLLAKRDEIT